MPRGNANLADQLSRRGRTGYIPANNTRSSPSLTARPRPASNSRRRSGWFRAQKRRPKAAWWMRVRTRFTAATSTATNFRSSCDGGKTACSASKRGREGLRSGLQRAGRGRRRARRAPAPDGCPRPPQLPTSRRPRETITTTIASTTTGNATLGSNLANPAVPVIGRSAIALRATHSYPPDCAHRETCEHATGDQHRPRRSRARRRGGFLVLSFADKRFRSRDGTQLRGSLPHWGCDTGI